MLDRDIDDGAEHGHVAESRYALDELKLPMKDDAHGTTCAWGWLFNVKLEGREVGGLERVGNLG